MILMLPVVTNNGSISNFFVFQYVHKIIDLYKSPYPTGTLEKPDFWLLK